MSGCRGAWFWQRAVLCLLVLASSGFSWADSRTHILRFVTYATERPAEEFRKMEPLQRQIESLLNTRGFTVRIDMRIYSTYVEAQSAIEAGQVDFARIGPASYVLLRERKAPIRLMVMESHQGSTQFEGAIIVRSDSNLRTVQDLYGKRMAFGDPSSTTGRYLPQAALVNAGIVAGNLGSIEYLGRHDKVVMAVATGTVDVGAANEGTIQKYADRGVRKLLTFPSPTQPWVVSTRLDPALAEALRQVMLQIKGEALKYIDREGFLPGDDRDFDTLRKAMRLSARFGG